jgi:hypothetical protein
LVENDSKGKLLVCDEHLAWALREFEDTGTLVTAKKSSLPPPIMPATVSDQDEG